jgi:hypothetical protein
MALKLTALLGIANGNDGIKARVKRVETDIYNLLKRPNLFSGFRKTYSPLDEENGERFPDEGEVLQHNVEDVLAELIPAMARAIDVQTMIDATNGQTLADLVIDRGAVENLVIRNIPVTTLIWLEKKLAELKVIVAAAPELNPTKTWIFDEHEGVYVTPARLSIKTRKVPKALVMYPATDRHPAQVQAYNEDETIGHWSTTDMSGAMPSTRKRVLLDRIAVITEGVKTARETANANAQVVEMEYGRELLEELLG